MDRCIVIFATAWGSRYGGINSFNYDLCRHLAKSRELNGKKVVCIVDEDPGCDSSDGVELFHLPFPATFRGYAQSILDILKGRSLEPIHTIGHDTYTGQRAIDVSKKYPGEISVAVFHHMDYAAYKDSDTEDNINKITDQENILPNADIVFAVGPKLEMSAIEKVRGIKKDPPVVRIQPGLADVEPRDIMPRNFSAITFGRIKEETRILKQIDLAAASFGRAVGNRGDLLGDSKLFVLGMSKQEIKEEIDKGGKNFCSQAQQQSDKQRADRRVNVQEWPYENDRGALLEKIKKQSVCMMLSFHDGFGLTGLEAISAGVPLILSENTGLYQALTNSLDEGGLEITYPFPVKVSGLSNADTIVERELDEVVKWLCWIAQNSGKIERDGKPGEIGFAKSKALDLRKQVEKSWTWEKAASKVLEAIYQNLNPPNPDKNVLSLTPSQSDSRVSRKRDAETELESNMLNSTSILFPQKTVSHENNVFDISTRRPLRPNIYKDSRLERIRETVELVINLIAPISLVLKENRLNRRTDLPSLDWLDPMPADLEKALRKSGVDLVSLSTTKQLLSNINSIHGCLDRIRALKYQPPSAVRDTELNNCRKIVNQVCADAESLLDVHFPKISGSEQL